MRTLHLVRTELPPGVVAEHDWIVELDAPDQLRLLEHGTPPLPTGPIDHDQLVQLLFAADRTITW